MMVLGFKAYKHVSLVHEAIIGRSSQPGVEALPSMLLPRKGRFGLIDYEKAFTSDLKNGPDIFDVRGIDRASGAGIVVRPDQHVATMLPLDAYDALADFFGQFMRDQR